MTTAHPTTGPYQAARKATLGTISHAAILKTARDLLRENQRLLKKRYTKHVKQALGAV